MGRLAFRRADSVRSISGNSRSLALTAGFLNERLKLRSAKDKLNVHLWVVWRTSAKPGGRPASHLLSSMYQR